MVEDVIGLAHVLLFAFACITAFYMQGGMQACSMCVISPILDRRGLSRCSW